jgi:outer membrane phospholipase A
MASSPRRTPCKQPSISAIFAQTKTAQSHRPSLSLQQLHSKSQGAAAFPAASGTPSPLQDSMEQFRAEVWQMISDLSQQLMTSVQTNIQEFQWRQQEHQPEQQNETPLQEELPTRDTLLEDFTDPELNWPYILEDLIFLLPGTLNVRRS